MDKIKIKDSSIFSTHFDYCKKQIFNYKKGKFKNKISDEELSRLIRLKPKKMEERRKNESKYNALLSSELDDAERREIEQMFRDIYKKFSGSKSGWGAYAFLEKLDITVCPYCNENYIYRILNKKKSPEKPDITIRADLDHFYSKNKFGLFALSLYNLVPSCKTCNSSIKGSVNFKEDIRAINPYAEAMDEYVTFRREPNNIDNAVDILLGYSKEFEFKSESKSIIDGDRAEYMLDFFGVIERYNHQHKEYIQRQVRREVHYNDEYKEKMKTYLETLDLSTDLSEGLTINDQSLGKLMNDCFKEISDF
ncbi:MAG: hypothetical protein RR523_12950 [Cetobacterium sp.]|uniref:hypothetical protein n=1 Tax=Cetobacterium sp. TaxID=2071632 RepID=UPI002FCBC33B